VANSTLMVYLLVCFLEAVPGYAGQSSGPRVGGNHPHAAGTRVRGDDVYLGLV
jgi:hypothetical protein